MKSTELMIGDWVSIPAFRKQPYYRVSVITDTYIEVESDCTTAHLIKPETVEPIPLTAEILEKNRFERRANRMFFYIDDFYIQGHRNGEWSMVGMIYPKIKFRYVHELQHALRLCGIDKEIIMPNTQES